MKFIVDFQERYKILDSFFAGQSSPISNFNVLSVDFLFQTDSSLSC